MTCVSQVEKSPSDLNPHTHSSRILSAVRNQAADSGEYEDARYRQTVDCS